ncbi:Sucrase/ferredoxin-like-domain-containing protein [Mariannaea sp. PMI_226]|nr:Sucrase/ferredoxin-like-domain-containing protein [Mariannaea sp. PMI_226]
MPSQPHNSTTAHPAQHMPVKQKMALSLKYLASSLLGNGSKGPAPPSVTELFPKTDPAVDGEDCLHDCDSCTIHYPRNFKIDTEDVLYGHVNAWSTHLLVGTSKTDWVRDVADEKGSVMEAVDNAAKPANGNMKLSASNMPTPSHHSDYSEPTTVLLLPAFTLVHNVHPRNVPQLITDIVSKSPTSTDPLKPFSIPASLPSLDPDNVPALMTADCPHKAVILMCSQATRDARCGKSAPLLKKELERQLRPLGLYRDLDDERPGGVGIYFISHVGGHKYSANVIIYRRPNAFGLDDVVGEKVTADGTTNAPATNGANGQKKEEVHESEKKEEKEEKEGSVGAAQCIWLARVKPEDCENLVKYTVLRGKLVKPESQLRGGFDRGRGVMSW